MTASEAPRPSWRAGLAAIALLVGLTLGLMEVGLRLFLPVRAVVYDLDPDLLHRYVPGAVKVFRHRPENGGQRVMVRVNEAGYRGPPLEAEGPRVVVFGDSFIAAEFSEHEQTFVARLSARLGVEVVNAGVPGYGPGQIARKIDREIDALRPSVAIVSIFVGNDYGDLARNRLYRLGPDGQVVDNRAVVSKKLQKVFADARRAAGRPALVRAAKTALKVMRTPPVEDFMTKYVESSLKRQRRDWKSFAGGDDEVHNLFLDTYDADMALFPSTSTAAAKRALMEGVLRNIDLRLRAAGVPWVLLIIPSPLDAASDYDVPFDTSAHPEYRPENLTRSIAQMAERRGWAYLNAFETLRETGDERLFYRAGDNHWTPEGQARVAAAMAAKLSALGIAPAPP